MEAAALRFYLDENMPIAVADQLRQRGITAVTVRDLALLGDSDMNHLARSTAMGYVLCTYDYDYVQLAATGTDHAGIILGQFRKQGVGDWVKGLILYHAIYDAQDMRNRVEYL
ncbi:MAG: DUF5615 family PIN-like protein [Anaerolineae bacterium]|nr:DUF5615 family PIN-like protein [Anaerolineae bacterium]